MLSEADPTEACPAEGLTMPRTKLPDCNDCRFSISSPPRIWCEAPQLQQHLDSTDDRRNRITDTEGARAFKLACGHQAVWFAKKGPSND